MGSSSEEQLLRPGVQNGEHADGRSDMASVGASSTMASAAALAVTLVGAQRVPELLGHGDGDVEIARRQHLGLAGFEPALGLSAMTFGATSVLAGMIGEDLGVALFATPEPPSKNLGAAGLDVGDGAPVRGRRRSAMSRQVLVREAAKDVRDLDHDGSAASEASHQSVEDGFERDAGRLGEVGVGGGGGDVDVADRP